MKLSEILTEARTGAFIFRINVNNASKVIANSKGKITYNTDIFQKKYVNSIKGDEIIKAGNKQTNISELKRIISSHLGIEMTVRIGSLNYSGIIDINE